MKKFSKIFALVCAFALIASAFAACGKNEKPTSSDDTLTMWAVLNANAASTITSYSDMMLYQELEKRTGIKVDFIHPIAGSTGNEAFMTMLSASEKPDIMEYTWINYNGGAQQAIDDGVIVALNDYLEQYAPNYYDYMEGEKGKANDYRYKLGCTTEEGNYYAFNGLNIGTTRCFCGIYVRGDKLDEWGMEIPETIDEWTAVFAKAKADGFDKPFTAIPNAVSFKVENNIFNTAYDVGKNFYLEDGKVVFAPFQAGYKDYVAQMAEWTKQGYIDTGFVTNDKATVKGNIVNGISVAAFGWISEVGEITTAVQEKNPNFRLVACPFPTATKGELPRFQDVSGEIHLKGMAISAQCADVESAIKWCDYIYGEEGSALRTFGIEGETYTVEEIDGEKHYVYTDKILKPETSGATSITEALYKHMLPSNSPGLNQHPDYLNGYYTIEAQKVAVDVWNKGVEKARPHMFSGVNYTEDELTEKTDILEIAEDELEVAITDIILGRKSIDAYDDAIEAAKANGYDRVIEINQAAYDRYMAKLDN